MEKILEQTHSDRLVREAIQMVCASLFLGLCAQIKIPLMFTPVPITGQTIGVLAIGATLGSRKGAIAVGLYLFQGIFGCPVFAGGNCGIAYFLGSTGGYLMAHPLEAFLIGWLLERKSRFATFLAFWVPCTIQLLLGSLWLSQFVGLDKMIRLGFTPFILLEIAKAIFITLGRKKL